MKEQYIALASEQKEARLMRGRERDSCWQISCAARGYALRSLHLARMFAKGTPYHLVERPSPMTSCGNRCLAISIVSNLIEYGKVENPSKAELHKEVERWMLDESQSSLIAA